MGLREAAAAVLTSDGREWEIRPMDGGGWRIWTRHQTAGERWSETVIFSLANSLQDAETEMFQEVVDTERWPGHYEAVTDESYDAMLADLAAQNEEAA